MTEVMRYRAPTDRRERGLVMPVKRLCPHMDAVVSMVEVAEPGLLDRLGIGRQRRRGGERNGTCWLEQGGRSTGDTYLELRLGHRESERQIWAALLAYQPLSRGGQTVNLGSTVQTYRERADEVTEAVAEAVRGWLVAHAAPAGEPAPPH